MARKIIETTTQSRPPNATHWSGRCMPRHRHQEFLKFLGLLDAQTPADPDLHPILDNYSTHKHDRVKP